MFELNKSCSGLKLIIEF